MATTRQRRRNHSVSEFDISFDARRTSVEPAKTGMKPSAASVICFRLNSRRGSLFFRAVDRNTKSSERQKEKRQKEKQTRQTIREPRRLRWVPTRRRRTRIKMEMSHQQLARPLHRTESKKENKIKGRRRPIGPFRRGDWSELAPAEERPVIIDVFID